MRLGLSETFAILRATPLATRHAGPLHYLIKLPLLFLPWTLLLPAWVLALARRGGAGGIGKEGIPDAMRFLLCWMLGVFLPLELSPARHSRYLLPLYPALALGVVAVFVHPQTVRSLTPGSLPVRLRGAGLVALRGALALLGAAAPVAAWSRLPHTPGLLLGSFVLGALLAFASLTRWSWLHDPQRQRFAFEQTLLVATLAFFFGDVASALHYAPLARRDDARRLLAPLVAGAPARCFGLDEDAQSTVLLATWHRVEAVRDPHALASWMAQEPPARRYVVTNPAGAEQLEKALRPALQRVGSVHLSSRTLVLLTGGASGRLPSARGSVTLAPSSEETAARGSPSHARVEALSAKTGGPRRHAVVSSPRSTMGEEGML